MKAFKIVFTAFMVLAFSYGVVAAQEDFRSDTSALAVGHQPLVDQLRQNAGDKVWIKASPKTGVVSYIGSDPSRPIRQPVRLGARPTPEQAARGFLSVYGPLLGVRDQARELRVMRSKQADRGRSFVRFQQVHAGVPVFGGESIVQVNASGNIISAHSKILPGIEGGTEPGITPEAAEQTAVDIFIKFYQNQYDLDASSLLVSEPELWIYNPMLVGMAEDVTSLVWRIEIRPEQLLPIREIVLVDAVSGRVLLHFNQNPHAKNRQIYDHNNQIGLSLPGPTLTRDEGGAASGIADVDKAYDYAGDTYDFYSTYHSRDSIDGLGMTLVSTTRYCPDAWNCPYANAFWTGPPENQMVYGQGFASADDVVAHEMTHGVTDYESNLIYLNQSGAINEAFSDIWGEFVDLTNAKGKDTAAVKWLCGEDLPIGAIRSLKNPPAYGDPDRMGSAIYYCSTCDQGGVHTNSGVGNKAAYLMTDGGTFNGVTVTGVGIDKVAKIFYEAQTNLLVSSSAYDDLGNALHQGCVNLIGTDGITWTDCTQVAKAITAVEMLNDQGTTPVNMVKNPGFEDGLHDAGGGNWVCTPQSAWTVYSSGTSEIISFYPNSCGYCIGWLGGDTDLTDYIYQDITIPADATVANLQFWYWIVTGEWGGVHDTMKVEIWNSTGTTLLKTLVTLSNLNWYWDWRKSASYNLLQYKGQTIRLRFYATNDSANPTFFLVDDIVLKKLGGANPPGVASFAINNNAASTAKRQVTLNNTAKNNPTQYMASANPDFLGAAWQPYSTAPSFTLSPGAGTKTIYFKVMNSEGESLVVTDTIEALGPTTTLKINAGAATTTKPGVTLNNTATNSPTHYMASEDPLFGGAISQGYSAAPQFALSLGAGTKTVYFKAMNEFAESLVVTDTITALVPTVTSFKVNAGAASTANGWVTLNNTATNSPTHYRASEDAGFAGASWQAYAAAPKFLLSDVAGTKTVWFQARNGFGESTPASSDTIDTAAGSAPVLTSFKINNNAATTTKLQVTLNNAATNLPTQYMASEDAGFAGAVWQTYAAAPSFTLDLGAGTRTVYFKVKNPFGVSGVMSDTITAPAATVDPFKINNGAATTTLATGLVTLNNTATGTPTHYMASEDAGFAGASWQAYSKAPKFTLSPGTGTKTVYFKVKNNFGESGASNDTIEAVGAAPTLTSLKINNNAATTTLATGQVTLNNIATGAPTHYMASEDAGFAGASWQAYSKAPKFTLSNGPGAKTVWFKVRNIFGESGALSDGITATGAAPTLTSVKINNGAASTNVGNGLVTLNNTATGAPTHYMASEDAGFAGASWQAYSKAPKFTLGGAGTRTVYFKVKNIFGESGALSDTILASGSVPAVTSFKINKGVVSTTAGTVTLNNTATNLPMLYMVSENPLFAAAVWNTYATAPSFILSAGSGEKTVYFKVMNIFGQSAVVSDTIYRLQ